MCSAASIMAPCVVVSSFNDFRYFYYIISILVEGIAGIGNPLGEIVDVDIRVRVLTSWNHLDYFLSFLPDGYTDNLSGLLQFSLSSL